MSESAIGETDRQPVVASGHVPLEDRVLVLWRIRIGIVMGFVTSSGGVVLGFTVPAAVTAVVLVVVVVPVGGIAWWWTTMVWRSWRFEIGTSALRLRHGVLTHRASTIPYHRVQHIDLEAGPLERRLRLTTLVLRTASASSDSTVPGIDAVHAEVVRSQILALVGSGDAT